MHFELESQHPQRQNFDRTNGDHFIRISLCFLLPEHFLSLKTKITSAKNLFPVT